MVESIFRALPWTLTFQNIGHNGWLIHSARRIKNCLNHAVLFRWRGRSNLSFSMLKYLSTRQIISNTSNKELDCWYINFMFETVNYQFLACVVVDKSFALC